MIRALGTLFWISAFLFLILGNNVKSVDKGLFWIALAIYTIIFAIVLLFKSLQLKQLSVLNPLALIALILFVSFKFYERQNHLSFVPEKLQVSTILYAEEESWGFGPGGNEAGVIVYELPDNVAKQVQKMGISYLTEMLLNASVAGIGWHRVYEKWQETPILVDSKEKDHQTISTKLIQKIDTIYGGYGITIAPDIENEINSAISKPGSYFAYGRIGILIVIPHKRKVVFAYNG